MFEIGTTIIVAQLCWIMWGCIYMESLWFDPCVLKGTSTSHRYIMPIMFSRLVELTVLLQAMSHFPLMCFFWLFVNLSIYPKSDLSFRQFSVGPNSEFKVLSISFVPAELVYRSYIWLLNSMCGKVYRGRCIVLCLVCRCYFWGYIFETIKKKNTPTKIKVNF